MSNSRKVTIAIIILLAIGILSIAGMAIYKKISDGNKETTSTTTNATMSQVIDETEATAPVGLFYDDKTYSINRNVTTFLFLGVDKQDTPATSVDTAVTNNGVVKYAFLFIFNGNDQTIDVVKVPFDTITPVGIYDADRNLVDTQEMALGNQYAFAESNARGCFLMRNSIQGIMGNHKIDYCCAISLEGLLSVVDSLDGVDVTLRNDWTDINPAYETDSTVHITADEAQEFLNLQDNTNTDNRFNRSDWFMLSLFHSMMSRGSSDIDGLMEAAGDDFENDVSEEVVTSLRDYTLDETTVIPADGDMQDLLVRLFYVEV